MRREYIFEGVGERFDKHSICLCASFLRGRYPITLPQKSPVVSSIFICLFKNAVSLGGLTENEDMGCFILYHYLPCYVTRLLTKMSPVSARLLSELVSEKSMLKCFSQQVSSAGKEVYMCACACPTLTTVFPRGTTAKMHD